MGEPIDFYDDLNHQQLYALEHLCGIPDFVKNAELEATREELANIPSESFADPRRRKFPCHNKAATYLANAYFQQAKPSYSKEESKLVQVAIIKYANYWKIANLVEQFNKNWIKVADFTPENLSDEKYALVTTTDDGHKVRRFPMANALQVKAAGEHLYANRFKYPYEWRKSAARRILKEAIAYDEAHKRGAKEAQVAPLAARFTPDAQEYLERASGFGMTHPQQAAEKIAQRVLMIRDRYQDYAVKLAEIGLSFSAKTTCEPNELQKLANIIDTVDRETGVCNHYNDGVDMPEEMFFDILEKDAEDFLDGHIRLQTGNSYPIGTFMHLPLEKLAVVLGNELVEAISDITGDGIDAHKFAEIAPTLPRDEAALLEKVLDESIREPLRKEARSLKQTGFAGDKASFKEMMKEFGHEHSPEDENWSTTYKLRSKKETVS